MTRRASILLIGVSLLAADVHAWPAEVHERILRLAVQLMPPTLAAQLERHEAELLAGLNSPDADSPADQHVLHADGTAGDLDQQVVQGVGRAVLAMRSRQGMADLARTFGRLSHLTADATFPLNTSASDPREGQCYQDYERYAVKKLSKFPAVFNGYEKFDGSFDLAVYVRTLSERANRGYPFVMKAYFANGDTMRSSDKFDDRGPEFGVTQLAFVSAVTGTANVWLYAWRSAHGDVGGTPFLETAGRTNDAKGQTGAAQRP